jgi:hypothetical protein
MSNPYHPPFSGLTGIGFLEDLRDDLQHLEEGFAACERETGKKAAQVSIHFTQPQITTALMNALEILLAIRRSASGLDHQNTKLDAQRGSEHLI